MDIAAPAPTTTHGVCAHCTNPYPAVPETDPDGNTDMVHKEGIDGLPTCDDCYCPICGTGHPTFEGREHCETLFRELHAHPDTSDPDEQHDRTWEDQP